MESGDLPLRDIHLPEAIGWWPPALGWWLLAVLIPLVLVFIFWLYKRLTRKSAIKVAKKMLTQITQDTAQENADKLKQISALLRRVAISLAGRDNCAGLVGQQWLEFLDRSVHGSPFTQGIGSCLANVPYQKRPLTDLEISQLGRLCEDWLNAQNKQKR